MSGHHRRERSRERSPPLKRSRPRDDGRAHPQDHGREYDQRQRPWHSDDRGRDERDDWQRRSAPPPRDWGRSPPRGAWRSPPRGARDFAGPRGRNDRDDVGPARRWALDSRPDRRAYDPLTTADAERSRSRSRARDDARHPAEPTRTPPRLGDERAERRASSPSRAGSAATAAPVRTGPRIIQTDAIAKPVAERAGAGATREQAEAEQAALKRAQELLLHREAVTGDALADEDETAEAERLLAESRRRRAEILARHKAQQAAERAAAQPVPAPLWPPAASPASAAPPAPSAPPKSATPLTPSQDAGVSPAEPPSEQPPSLAAGAPAAAHGAGEPMAAGVANAGANVPPAAAAAALASPVAEHSAGFDAEDEAGPRASGGGGDDDDDDDNDDDDDDALPPLSARRHSGANGGLPLSAAEQAARQQQQELRAFLLQQRLRRDADFAAKCAEGAEEAEGAGFAFLDDPEAEAQDGGGLGDSPALGAVTDNVGTVTDNGDGGGNAGGAAPHAQHAGGVGLGGKERAGGKDGSAANGLVAPPPAHPGALAEGAQSKQSKPQLATAAAAGESAGPAAGGDALAGGAGGFDMFSDSPVLLPPRASTATAAASAADGAHGEAKARAMLAAAQDRGDANDDVEGYYAHRVGDVLDGRFRILSTYGRGVFSTVVKCVELGTGANGGGGSGGEGAGAGAGSAQGGGRPWAIKILRNNDMMRRAGEKEAAILERLRAADPADGQHVIKYGGQFMHEDHLCLAFEAMHQNLRQALRQHGHRRGIQIDAVRTYARHMLTALRLVDRCGIIHADLKPDNMVVNERYNTLKLCDLGSAMEVEEAEITPLLQSRFYRAPEVMLGLQYGTAVDVWSAGCTIFELFTGKFLFAGSSNNAMLRVQQEVRGKVPARMLRKAAFAQEHFSPDGDFLATEKDKVTGRDVVREIRFAAEPVPGRDLKSQIFAAAASAGGGKLQEGEQRKMALLVDLLDKLLILDPARRITAAAALKHPFITSKG